MQKPISSLMAVSALALASFASAQVQPGSLSIKGGETFTVGQVVDVSLIQTLGHNNGKYDFYYSKDNGTKWTEIIGNYQGPKEDGATVTYKWTVPNAVTTQGMFRACEMAGGECLDPAYILKSGAFSIVPVGTGLNQAGSKTGSAPSMSYATETRSLETSFELGAAQKVTLQAFDGRGRLLATLLDGRREAGIHHLSLFSNRLETVSGQVLFRLTLGGDAFTSVVNILR